MDESTKQENSQIGSSDPHFTRYNGSSEKDNATNSDPKSSIKNESTKNSAPETPSKSSNSKNGSNKKKKSKSCCSCCRGQDSDDERSASAKVSSKEKTFQAESDPDQKNTAHEHSSRNESKKKNACCGCGEDSEDERKHAHKNETNQKSASSTEQTTQTDPDKKIMTLEHTETDKSPEPSNSLKELGSLKSLESSYSNPVNMFKSKFGSPDPVEDKHQNQPDDDQLDSDVFEGQPPDFRPPTNKLNVTGNDKKELALLETRRYSREGKISLDEDRPVEHLQLSKGTSSKGSSDDPPKSSDQKNIESQTDSGSEPLKPACFMCRWKPFSVNKKKLP